MVRKKLILVLVFFLFKSLEAITLAVGSSATVDGSHYVAGTVFSQKKFDSFTFASHARESAISSINYQSALNQFNYTLLASPLEYRALLKGLFIDRPNLFAEFSGINESGVVVSSVLPIINNANVLQLDPYSSESGIDRSQVTRLLLSAATSAEDGVLLLGSIIDKQGAAEGFSVVVSDQQNSWSFETASGHHWIASKLPEDGLFISNGTSRTMFPNLGDNQNYLGSRDLILYAEEHNLGVIKKGFWSWLGIGQTKESFNFYQAYMSVDHNKNIQLESLGAFLGATDKIDTNFIYPLFNKITESITLAKLRSGLRYAYSLQLQEESKIYPVFSYIIQIRPNYPQDIANIEYIAIGDPNLSIYLPFYWGLPDIPEEYRIIPDNKIDFSSILWRYWKLQFLVRQNYTKYAPLVQAQFISFEQEMNAKQVEVEKAYLKIYEIAPQQADSLLEEFTLIIINQADMVLDKLTKQLAHDLQMEKLNDNDYLAKMNESAS